MANELIINASLPEIRIALQENGEIQDLLIERASDKGIVGNIYKGRVTRVLPGMQAAFVDIGLEKAAFLYVDDVYVHSDSFDEEDASDLLPSDEPQIAGPSALEPEALIVAPLQESESSSETEGQLMLPLEASEQGDSSHDEAHAESQAESKAEKDEDDQEEEPPVLMTTEDEPEGDETSKHQDSSSQPQSIAPPEVPQVPEIIVSSAEGDEDSSDASNPDAKGRRRSKSSGQRRANNAGANRRSGPRVSRKHAGSPEEEIDEEVQKEFPSTTHEDTADSGIVASDRSQIQDTAVSEMITESIRPEEKEMGSTRDVEQASRVQNASHASANQKEFKATRARDKRIRSKSSLKPAKAQVNIQDLLKEGQEVLVQVAKDPISSKGARLTCHISLPGRHLVCMPTIDHVGVSRRIEKEDERKKLREFVEKNRPKKLGFIVRTASGKQQSEKRIKQDIEYLSHLWSEIRDVAVKSQAPALVYEDLNSVLRAVRDWVNEDIDKVVVDSRHHFNEIQRFASHFMPTLKQKVELYHGDVPIFDAYGISTELSRALERKVWLKSGGYIVVDQAEALVAIDVNTGRYVGKKNLEDTILKTNLEAVQEIAYQLRLRNCGGIIILDFIDMEKEENRLRVYKALEEALLRDRARPSILKISELGLVEMTRKRTRDTMVRTLCEVLS